MHASSLDIEYFRYFQCITIRSWISVPMCEVLSAKLRVRVHSFSKLLETISSFAFSTQIFHAGKKLQNNFRKLDEKMKKKRKKMGMK